jgi:hypothetical protein
MHRNKPNRVTHIVCVFSLGFAVVGMLHASSVFASDKQQLAVGIQGLWSGADTNDPLPSAFLCVKLATNGQGAFISGGLIGIPGTFTYTLSEGRIDYLTNSTLRLGGTLRYDAGGDLLIYQARPARASRAENSQGPVIMFRDADELKDKILGLVLGATNQEEVMARLRPVLEKLRGATNYDDAVARLQPMLGATTNGERTAPGKRSRRADKGAETGKPVNSPERTTSVTNQAAGTASSTPR